MKKLSILFGLFLLAAIVITSCVKKSFDNPPDQSGDDPKLPVNMTIMQLRKMLPNTLSATDTMLITQDYTIAAIVNADDRSGNLYKQIYVQDSTGGIQLNIDAYSLYANYPVGRKIYIKLKGLYLSYSGATGTPSLSGAINEQGGTVGITGAQVDNHIIKANTGNVVKDTVISFNTARGGVVDALLCRLVTISDSVQFADTIRTYTDPTAATNRYITTCGSNLYVGNSAPSGTMAVRTDNYASFHALKLPYGKGTIRGIYTVFHTTPQLILRDTGDVRFYGPRCGAVAPPPGTIITIDSLRKMYPATTTIGSARVSAVVISDVVNGNVSSGNFILEDGSKKGIILYLPGANYSLGDSLLLDVSGGKLSLYQGAMELTNVLTTSITKVGTGRSVTPIVVTLSQLSTNFAPYESVLVRVASVTVTAGGTYSGNKVITDPTGSFNLFTGSTAAFAGQSVPTSPKTFTGIGTLFTSGNEIKIRNPAIDVQ